MIDTGVTTEPAADVPAPEGVRNFRDAGGVGALPRGVLYRSGALDAWPATGARALAGIGVRTVVDLRSDPEMAERPDLRHGLGFAYTHVPVFAERRWPAAQTELYPAMAKYAARPVIAVLRALLDQDTAPVLVHCASGKDRTGVVVALVQTLLGASPDEVTADFVRSNARLGLTEQPPGAAHNRLPVSPGHLRLALAWIRERHGGVEGCLLAHGARRTELDRLTTALRGS